MGVALCRDVRRLHRVFDALKLAVDRPPPIGVYAPPLDKWFVVARRGVVELVTRDARCALLRRGSGMVLGTTESAATTTEDGAPV